MSDTHDFPGSTHHFGPPPGLEEMVGWLHVFSNGHCTVSAWKPNAEELARLNAGESIFVSVMSGSKPARNALDMPVRIPLVHPTFVGTEEAVKAVVSDTGSTW